jgi:hypothetical protein
LRGLALCLHSTQSGAACYAFSCRFSNCIRRFSPTDSPLRSPDRPLDLPQINKPENILTALFIVVIAIESQSLF